MIYLDYMCDEQWISQYSLLTLMSQKHYEGPHINSNSGGLNTFTTSSNGFQRNRKKAKAIKSIEESNNGQQQRESKAE